MGPVGVICWLWIQKKTAFENLNADAACDELGRAAMLKWTKWNNWNRAKVSQAVHSTVHSTVQCCGGNCQAECSAVRKVFVEISDCVTAWLTVM